MKNYIFKSILGLLMSMFPLYCLAEESLVKLGKEEEKARITMLENPTPENIAKHKEITKELLNSASNFSEKYCKDKKINN